MMNEVINIIGRGVTDPHIHIFEGRAYLYASHDYSIENKDFVMKDWQIYSSDDLLSWELECTLTPDQTFIGGPSDGCWATDAVQKGDHYYWAFSEVKLPEKIGRIGIVRSSTPAGPWEEYLHKPLLDHDAAPTEVYDPSLYKDQQGRVYIIFGAFNYYIVQLRDDMTGPAHEPKKIEIENPCGPYGPGKSDDKPSLHERGGLYYLSWGGFYATSTNLYGPYTYRGCIIDPLLIEERFKSVTWPNGPTQGRHGNFFDWKGQWYFTYCEMCFSGNRYYRDFWISRLDYDENGMMNPVKIGSKAILE